MWLAGYRIDSKTTESELGVFNLLQSLRACASAHVIHHVDENMPQSNNASAFCRTLTLQLQELVLEVLWPDFPFATTPKKNVLQLISHTKTDNFFSTEVKGFFSLFFSDSHKGFMRLEHHCMRGTDGVLVGQAREFGEAWKEEIETLSFGKVEMCCDPCECVCTCTSVTPTHCHSVMQGLGEVLLEQGQTSNKHVTVGHWSLLLNAWPAPQSFLREKKSSPDGLT